MEHIPHAIITGKDRGEAPLRSVTSFDRSPKFNPTNLLGCREYKQRESHPSHRATRLTFKRPVTKSFKADDKFISHRCTCEADDCSGEIRARLIYDVIIPDFKEPYDELGNTFSVKLQVVIDRQTSQLINKTSFECWLDKVLSEAIETNP